jgi:hypothetical protein
MMISWTPERLQRFKKAYAKAVEANVETFKFDEKEFVVGYAKYLIEYLDNHFSGRTA